MRPSITTRSLLKKGQTLCVLFSLATVKFDRSLPSPSFSICLTFPVNDVQQEVALLGYKTPRSRRSSAAWYMRFPIFFLYCWLSFYSTTAAVAVRLCRVLIPNNCTVMPVRFHFHSSLSLPSPFYPANIHIDTHALSLLVFHTILVE